MSKKKVVNANQDLIDLVEKLILMREKRFLTKGYAQRVADKVGVSKNAVYQTMARNNYKIEIIEALIDEAQNGKTKELLRKADDILS